MSEMSTCRFKKFLKKSDFVNRVLGLLSSYLYSLLYLHGCELEIISRKYDNF